MISQDLYRRIRTLMITVPLAMGTGVFWTFLLVEAIRYLFKFDENRTFVLFGLPFFALYCIWSIKSLPKALRKAGYIE
jgi:hypothetical protein